MIVFLVAMTLLELEAGELLSLCLAAAGFERGCYTGMSVRCFFQILYVSRILALPTCFRMSVAELFFIENSDPYALHNAFVSSLGHLGIQSCSCSQLEL